MSWLTRLFGREEKRALTSLPFNIGGYLPTEMNVQRAMALVPVWSSIRLLADNAASLPLQAYRRMDDGTGVPMNNPPSLIAAPSAVSNRHQWIHQAVLSLALRGNAYGLVTARDGFGYPTSIEWLNPDEVHVDETQPTLPVFYWRGKPIPRGDVFHIPWMVLPGHVVGISPVTAFANTLGVGLAATRYGESWFDNGGTPPATFQNVRETVSTDEAREIRDRTVAAMKSRKPLVFGSDWKFEALKVTPEESQFIGTMKLNATQVAAIYGVPPEKVGGERGSSMTYASVEQESIDFVQYSLRPWLVLLEQAISDVLPDRQYVRFNVDALIRTDIKTRYEAHALALQNGWKNVDEVRAVEDLQPLPHGQGTVYRPQVEVPITPKTIRSINGNGGVPSLINGSTYG
jgi:HK97 family phage portal protein